MDNETLANELTPNVADAVTHLTKTKGEVVAISRLPHIGDYFLFLVMIDAPSEYIVWTYNAQVKGCSDGSYFTYPKLNGRAEARMRAFENFIARLKARL